MRNAHTMEQEKSSDHGFCCCRREFLQTAGAVVGAMTYMSTGTVLADEGSKPEPREKKTPALLGAFVYTPTEQLKKEGYWSWPGSSFDPEGHQWTYTAKIEQAAQRLNTRIELEPKPLADDDSVSRFLARVKLKQPDGLLLFFFKKSLNEYVPRILDATKVPTILSVPMGTLLIRTVKEWQLREGVYLVDSDQDFEAVLEGVRMIGAARWMKDARLVNIRGTRTWEAIVPHLETQIRTIPNERFVEAFRAVEISPEVRRLAQAYRSQAKEVVEPTRDDIQEAAKCYFALKRVLKDEQGDALMMSCLSGIVGKPCKHVPPCMGFMSLHDEGIVAGCQADLEPALTMMLGSQLLGATGFMHNPSWNLAENNYYGAHCTCPSKMGGPDSEALPYILRSHAEAGWGCVPQVLFPADQPATMVHYFAEKEPRMSVYTGRVVRSYAKLPGGCRTNFSMNIDGVKDVLPLDTGGHQVLFFGNHGKRLKAFCKLNGIKVTSA